MSIRISQKYGVNPAIPVCFFCTEPKNELILAGRLPNDEEAPQNAVWDMEPCDKCKSFMEQGIILVSVKNGEKGNNPYRTGGWVVVKEGIFNEDCKARKTRFAFIEDEEWDAIGLPRE